MKPWLAVWMLVPTALLGGCGEGPAFGFGDAQPRAAEDESIDRSGWDMPAALGSADQAAMAAAGMVKLVAATAGLSSELGRAAGDLFPDRDNPCPGGGDAQSDVSGSLRHPRIRMQFDQCLRERGRLHGVATLTCQELDGSDCVRADVQIGDGSDVLRFDPAASDPPSSLLMRGFATARSDSGAGRLHVVADLEGELRAVQGPARWSFFTQQLTVDLQELPDDAVEARIAGVAGFGGGAAEARCATGRLDNETPAEPLLIRERSVHSGQLLLHSPPPRPGASQARVVFSDGGATAQGGDGDSAVYDAQTLQGLCSLS